MSLNTHTLKGYFVPHMVIDWVEVCTGPWNGSARKEFYRGTIDSVDWQRGFPRAALRNVTRFYPRLRVWKKKKQIKKQSFDFSQLAQAQIVFDFQIISDAWLRFDIRYGTVGIISSKTKAGGQHLFFRKRN